MIQKELPKNKFLLTQGAVIVEAHIQLFFFKQHRKGNVSKILNSQNPKNNVLNIAIETQICASDVDRRITGLQIYLSHKSRER